MYGLILVLTLSFTLIELEKKDTIFNIFILLLLVLCVVLATKSVTDFFLYVALAAAGVSLASSINVYYENIIQRLNMLRGFDSAKDNNKLEKDVIKNNRKKIIRKQNLNK